MTGMSRETPFALVMGTIAPDRFPVLREGLAAAGRNSRDRDEFLMVREVVELLREIEPEEGLGEGIGTMAAFLHHAYLYWMDGARTALPAEPALEAALRSEPAQAPAAERLSRYVQLPALRVWGQPMADGPVEPLDGWFAYRDDAGLRVLAIFGLHPGRAGFTAVEVAGDRPEGLERPDGSALFSGTLPGAERAGLASSVGAEELLELAWRLWS
ncbi:MAG TPA: hypothetical protein VFU23_07950 [Gemmatimonadales bacterium]|nr:hypothetical protein [Gemmatimonadales bacterium]